MKKQKSSRSESKQPNGTEENDASCIMTMLELASVLASLVHGERVKLTAITTRLAYKNGDERGGLPFRIPAGTYAKSTDDDLITFIPDAQGGVVRG